MTVSRWISLLFLTIFAGQSFAAAVIDVHTQRLIDTGKTQHSTANLAKTFQKNGETYIHIFIEGQVAAIPALRALGVDINTVTASGIMSASAPLQKIIAVSQVTGVKSITAAHAVKKMMDTSVGPIGVNLPNTGFPRGSHTGKGVVVGVIDTGIDIGHRDFFDADENTRIGGIWDHTLDAADVSNMATAPAGFSYGTHWTQSQIQGGYATCLSRDTDGHGTHVAGTAAGSGRAGGFDSNYTGIAPESTLYIVKFDFDNVKNRNTETAIIDGINWIFQQAQAANMPAVINMSLGSDFGPHDGSTAEERGIDDLTGPDKIVVVAAGNAGAVYGDSAEDTFTAPIHGAGDANVSNDIVIETAPNYTPSPETDYIFWDIWYAGSDSMRVQITTPSGAKYPSSFNGPNRTLWKTNGRNGGFNTPDGTIYVANKSATNAGWDTDNGDNNIYVELSDIGGTEISSGKWIIELIPETGSGEYHAWHGFSRELRKTFFWYNSGSTSHAWGDISNPWLSNNEMTIGKPATAMSVISVGAYQTKNSWTARLYSDSDDPTSTFSQITQSYGVAPIDYYSPFTLEDLAYFSSRGPARDGRTQPAISAPGVGIIASLSQTVLNDPNDNYFRHLNRVEFGGNHAALQGTSMACPHVTGVTAILLEKTSSLGISASPADIRGFIQSGARADGFTGSVPNNDWGYGKIDTTLALSEIQVPVLDITTDSLPNATQGVSYSTTLAASGGQAPYAWAISTGNLPSGLSLDSNTGIISGTPTTAETANFTITLTDAAAGTDTESLSITVNTPSLNPSIAGVSPNTAAPGERLTLTITGDNFQPGATVSMGTDIIVKQTTVISSTEVQVNISVKKRATASAIDVTVTNPDGGSSTIEGAFSIL